MKSCFFMAVNVDKWVVKARTEVTMRGANMSHVASVYKFGSGEAVNQVGIDRGSLTRCLSSSSPFFPLPWLCQLLAHL